MGLFDKLKNIFFEEEYVEVEEPIKKDTKKAEKVAVAKKIDIPEAKKEYKNTEIEEKGPVIEIADEDKPKEYRFPMQFDDKDFKLEDSFAFEKREERVVEVKPIEEPKSEKVYEEAHYSPNVRLYEGGENKKEKSFRPSPIISPIYGVLDKNYKKEEIVTKKEIRLSSSSTKIDLDTVREKAYGDLANDITASIMETDDNIIEDESDQNLFYDLNEEEQPAVKNVTVGDAEEYFNELGLEYNIDYKIEKNNNSNKEIATGRRSQKESSEDITNNDSNKDVEDNLFDLIDSMYEDKE